MAVVSLKCPNCDGGLHFDPQTQAYQCEYCRSLFSQKELEAMEQAQEKPKVMEQAQKEPEAGNQGREQDGGGNADVYTCPSCGAQIMTDHTTAATTCYYCHNAVVIGGRLSGDLLPNRIIPFEVTKAEAKERFLEFVGKRRFVPRQFFDDKNIEENMRGIYFPYWLYSVRFQSEARGKADRFSTWPSGNTEYRQRKYYTFRREGDISFENLPENALSKISANLLGGVMPFEFDRAKEFHMGYLSGFAAECRDIGKADLLRNMQRRTRDCAKEMIRSSVSGYDSVSVRQEDYRVKEEDMAYVLLPVWTITYTAKDGGVYYYTVNGQTGSTCGDLPLDRRRLAVVSGLISFVVLLAGMFWGYFL